MGLRVMTPRQIRAAADVSIQHALNQWASALARPEDTATGRTRPTVVSLLEDWHRYSGHEYRDLLESAFTAQDRVNREWADNEPHTSEQAAEFYDRTDTLTPLLLWWHGTATRVGCPAHNAATAAAVFRAVGAERILDFGSGIGSTALALATQGHEVVLSEVSRDALAFSTWRLDERGLKSSAIDLLDGSLRDQPAGSVDGVVSFDVFEHLIDTQQAVRDIDRLLAPGGIICANQLYVVEDHAGHIPHRGDVLQHLHHAGYRLVHVPHVFWIAQKAPLGPLAHARQAAELRLRLAVARAVESEAGRIRRSLHWRLTHRAVD